MTIQEHIKRTRAELGRLKPHARRRVKLETRLQILMLQQLRYEIRIGRRRR